MRFRFTSLVLLAALMMLAILDGCGPGAPRRTLGTEDKTTDLYWLFSQFNENYAPLELKQQRYAFNYEALKTKYLADAQTTKNNEEFYKLMFKFVSEFKDAHTSASLLASQLPARAKIAYLGFSGKRVGEALVVTELLPTIAAGSEFSIKVGDRITKLDGVSLRAAVLSEMVNYRNLGNEESNVTYHMNKLFSRTSVSASLPTSDTAVLTVVRDEKERQVALPWIVKDLYVFSAEQKAATAPKPGAAPTPDEKPAPSSIFQLGFLRTDGKIEATSSVIASIIRDLPNFSFWNTFKFIDTTPTWATKLINDPTATNLDTTLTGFEALKANRLVPKNAIPLADTVTFPTYVTREKVRNKAGKETGATRFVATMYLSTFSPQAPEPLVMKEVQATLDKLKEFGVTDVVIDMINNGGGSLTLGMKIAQALSREKVVQPDIQFRLSETWLDSFERGSLINNSDAERELSRRVFETLKTDLASGKRLSRRLSVESLEPFGFAANDKLHAKLNIVLLVNEMCASMCDIFSGIMKDNNLAKIVGTKTMGAGGNVVDHFEAPNSHMSVRQTESLIVRTGANDGVYIENNGVEPDVEVKVSESTLEKYAPVRAKALELLLTEAN